MCGKSACWLTVYAVTVFALQYAYDCGIGSGEDSRTKDSDAAGIIL